MHDKHILKISLPVPVPEIKRFSRWQVLKALFDRKAHFTTCEALQLHLHNETKAKLECWKENR